MGQAYSDLSVVEHNKSPVSQQALFDLSQRSCEPTNLNHLLLYGVSQPLFALDLGHGTLTWAGGFLPLPPEDENMVGEQLARLESSINSLSQRQKR